MALAIGSGPAVGDRAAILRGAIVAGAGLMVAVASTGAVAERLFAQPSTAKYLITVLAPLTVALLALTADPSRALLTLAIVVTPFNFVSTFGGVAVSPTLLLVAGGATLALFEARADPDRRPLLAPALWLAVALLLPAVLTGATPLRSGLWLAQLAGAGWLAFRVARRPGGLEPVLWAVVVAALIQAVLAIWGFKTGQRFDFYESSGQTALAKDDFFNFDGENRPSAAMPDPISLGHVLALACPLALVLAHRARTLDRRLLAVGAGLVIGIGLTLTFSRMSWIGAAAGVVVAVLLLPGARRWASVLAVAGILLAVVSAGLAFGGPALQARFDSIADPTARSNSTSEGDVTRVRLWNAALDTAQAHPALGVGFGNIAAALAPRTSGVQAGTHAHSTYLQFAAEAGLAGLIALIALIGATAVDLVRGLRRERILVAGCAGACVSVLVVWTTDYTVRYVQVGAIVAVVLGAIAAQSLPRAGRRGGA